MNTNPMPLNEEQGVPQWNYPTPQVNIEKTEPIPIPRSHCCCYLNDRVSAAVMHAQFQIRASSVHAAHGQTVARVHQVLAALCRVTPSESLGDKHALRWSATITLRESNSSVSISPIFKSKKDADKVRVSSRLDV